jgi:hypothetical protein
MVNLLKKAETQGSSLTDAEKNKIGEWVKKIKQLHEEGVGFDPGWLPGTVRPITRIAAVAKPIPPAKPLPIEPPKTFPTAPEELTQVSSLGGSTGAMLMQDASGKKFVVKKGADAAHLTNEAHADAAYKAAGLNVPDFHVYQTPQGPVKVAEFVEGDSLAKVMSSGDTAKIKKVKKELEKGFAADALLGNWDVIGLDKDNILIDKSGKVWRIDNGGSLNYRAQGAKKEEAWGDLPVEIWTLRGKMLVNGKIVNQQTNELYGDLGYDKVVKQMRDLADKRDAILESLPVEEQDRVAKRIDVIEHLAQAGERMETDKWKVDFQDDFGLNIVKARQAGIVDKMPNSLTTKVEERKYGLTFYSAYDVMDENGEKFGGLRGSGGVVSDIVNHINSNGGNFDVLPAYMNGQAGNSWNDQPKAIRWALVKMRGIDPDKFYWQDGSKSAKACYDKFCSQYGGEEVVQKTIRMYHAIQYEFITKVDLPNKNPDGTITIFRTESDSVINGNSLETSEDKVIIKRGALESFSIFRPENVHGDNLTYQDVEPHRIFASYFFSRDPYSYGGCFFKESENEVIVMPEDIPFVYPGSI